MAELTPKSPFNRSAQHDAKRVAILSEAARLFNSRGSRATTLRDIAEGLGLTKTSLYYYVRTKEDLIYQCYLAALGHHGATLDKIEARYNSPIERLGAFLRSHFESWLAAREGRGPHIAAMLEIASLKGHHRETVEAGYVDLFKRVRQYLRDGVAAGMFRACETNSTARAILGSVEWTFYWLHSVPQTEVMGCADSAVDIILYGLASGATVIEPARIAFDTEDPSALQGFNREEQNRLKQQAFYKAGTWFFNKQGFNGTSLDEIAERLNVSKGAFYYHIRNKEDLLHACYLRTAEILDSVHLRAAQDADSGFRRLEQSCRRTFHVQNSENGPLIRYNTITALPVERRKAVLSLTESSNRRFNDFLRAGITDGSIRSVDVGVAYNLLIGAMNAAMDIRLWRRVDDLDQAAIDYFDVFFNGLIPRSPPVCPKEVSG
jgi:AcrR family transcriptional regulator